MKTLHIEISKCEICKSHLPQPPNPVLQFSETAKLLVIGQAPGRLAHESNTPWDDKSGDRLRDWLDINREQFYNEKDIALVPMGFCYPGTGKTGDLPPRKECAPQWHPQIFNALTPKPLKLLVGKYAQDYYLKDKNSIVARCKHWREYAPDYLVFPHPSPRNNIWLKKNPWFEAEVIPEYRREIKRLLQ